MNMATILHVYCSLSYIQTSIFTLLYQYNIDVNAIDKLGRNGLHYAAISNNIYAFEWLVQHGCRLEAVDTQHYRPEDVYCILRIDLPSWLVIIIIKHY